MWKQIFLHLELFSEPNFQQKLRQNKASGKCCIFLLHTARFAFQLLHQCVKYPFGKYNIIAESFMIWWTITAALRFEYDWKKSTSIQSAIYFYTTLGEHTVSILMYVPWETSQFHELQRKLPATGIIHSDWKLRLFSAVHNETEDDGVVLLKYQEGFWHMVLIGKYLLSERMIKCMNAYQQNVSFEPAILE